MEIGGKLIFKSIYIHISCKGGDDSMFRSALIIRSMHCRLPNYVVYSVHEEHNLMKTLFHFCCRYHDDFAGYSFNKVHSTQNSPLKWVLNCKQNFLHEFSFTPMCNKYRRVYSYKRHFCFSPIALGNTLLYLMQTKIFSYSGVNKIP